MGADSVGRVPPARVVGCWRICATTSKEGYEHPPLPKWTNVRSLTDPAFWLAVVSGFLFLLPTRCWRSCLFTVGAIVLALVQTDPRRSARFRCV